jgi:hypothetical protein
MDRPNETSGNTSEAVRASNNGHQPPRSQLKTGLNFGIGFGYWF